MQVRFKQWDCDVQFKQYFNGRTAIQLNDIEDGAPVAVATVNVPSEDIADNEVVIKDYSENAGIVGVLIDGEIIKPPHQYIRVSEYVICPVCYLVER